MARTLQQLKESIENLIQYQGQNSPVAAFIFTIEDVYSRDDQGNPMSVSFEIGEKVLSSLQDDYDFLYEEVFDFIENKLEALAEDVY